MCSVKKMIYGRYLLTFSYNFCVMVNVIVGYLIYKSVFGCFIHILDILLMIFLRLFSSVSSKCTFLSVKYKYLFF